MSKASDIRLTRFIVGALVAAVAAGSWDIWWHTAISRDTFFEPPHLLLYAAIIAAIIASTAGGVLGGFFVRQFARPLW